MNMQDKMWMWGYTQEVPGSNIPFIGSLKSHCSLETAADYFGMNNTVFMNSMHTLDRLEENLELVKDSKQVLCGLPHGEKNAVEGAKILSEMSLKYPNIKGIVLDDFLQLSGHPTTPELVKAVRDNLRSANPELEIYVVLYSDLNHLDITPYLDLIDGIILWRWVSTEHFWKAEFGSLIHRFKEIYKKKLLHGLYIQNYGEYSSGAHPIDFELWKLQCMKVLCAMRGEYAFLDGCVLLQNGWVANPEFRDHVVWLKETIDWFCGTTTIR